MGGTRAPVCISVLLCSHHAQFALSRSTAHRAMHVAPLSLALPKFNTDDVQSALETSCLTAPSSPKT